MEEIIKKAYDPEWFREEGHKLVDKLADFLSENVNGVDKKVINYKDPNLLLTEWEKYFNESGFDLQEFYQKVIDDGIHIHHPKYIGHQVSPSLPIAGLSDFLGTQINNGMAIYEMGQSATVMEKIVINWLCSKIGYNSESDGIITSGGSLGNLTAMLAARQIKTDYNIWEDGVNFDNKPAIMVSEQSHYSNARAVKIMGLGDSGIIKLPVNEKFQIDVNKLEEVYEKEKRSGKNIIAIIANACSTSTGSYDDLDFIAYFCKKNNIWMHVDAAHGGPAIFSEKYKLLVKGIEKADSIVIDFHKMMLASALTTAVIFKNGQHSYQTFEQKAAYLLEKKSDWYNVAGRSLECTKKAMSVKLFASLKMYGKELYEAYINKTYDLAREFASYVKELKAFELAIEPESNIVCFRKISDGEDENILNASIRQKLLEDGRFYIVQTSIEGKIFLRITIMNPFTTMKDLEEMIKLINTIK